MYLNTKTFFALPSLTTLATTLDSAFTEIVTNLDTLEDVLTELSNGANELNNKVEIFPSSIFAAMCGIKAQPFFETDEVSKQSINASDYLK